MWEVSRSKLLVAAILAEVSTIIVAITLLLQWRENRFDPVLYTDSNSAASKSKVTSLKCGSSQTARFGGVTWEKKTFCHDFLVNTFHEDIPMCGGAETGATDQVRCYGSVYAKMAVCVYENLSLRPQLVEEVVSSDTSWNQPKKKSINLLQNTSVDCTSSSMENLQKKTNSGDFENKLTQHLLRSEKLPPSVCDVWINKTTFFHVSNAVHIYFRFLDLYNVHKALLDYGGVEFEGNQQVMRIGNLKSSYLFPEFDKALFPGSLTLDSLRTNGTACFRKVVFVPTSYQSSPFRCKMNRLLRNQCFQCSGKGLTDSPFHSFRRRVLWACNITETDYCNKPLHLTVVSRKPYKRWPTDNTPNFQRVLQNEDAMVDQIRKSFPNVTVSVVHMEDLGICEQVRSAVEADVMLGVHGAGLVHFWWLRDEATAVELEPSFETGNPSFRMLTTLAGRNYVSEMVGGISSRVSVNIQQLIQKLEQIILPRN